MKIAVLGGAGAMGGIFGGRLAAAGEDVTLIDVSKEAVDAINSNGLQVEDASGMTLTVKVAAAIDPATIGTVDLLLVFVKCYHTEAAVRSALSTLGPNSVVMTLQNGWGNAARIGQIVGDERVLVGLTYNSGTLLSPGHVRHTAKGMTFAGELNGNLSPRLIQITEILGRAGFDVTPTSDILKEIWSKLSLNVCSLPTSAVLRFFAHQLMEHDGTERLMQALLQEVVTVANAQNIPLDFDERWQGISAGLKRAVGAKSSMLQDVERSRRTEIDVINGAIVEAGQRLNIPTPYNNAMVFLVKSLEETFATA